MEHRPLLAVALVAGCVTAAGTGGYLAVRQMAAPTAPAQSEQLASIDTAGPTSVVEGTEGEILPVADEPAAPAAADLPAAPAAVTRTTPAATAAPRPAGTASRPPASRPAGTASSTAAPRPAAARRPEPSVERETSRPAPRPAPEATSRPAEAVPPAPPAPAPATDDGWGSADSWPSRDATPSTRDDQWPPRDADTTADASLPNRAPAADPASAPAPLRRLESITIPADSVIGVQLESTISTQTARVEDPVRARVTRDVRAGGTVVVPAGSRLLGSVTLVEEGGKIRERSRLGVRFHTLVLADGSEVRLPTETIYRDGESPTGRSAAKIGGATVGGAILGAILGGGKGAIIGAATGAGSGTAVAMAGERRPAELRSGQPITVRVSDTVTTEVQR